MASSREELLNRLRRADGGSRFTLIEHRADGSISIADTENMQHMTDVIGGAFALLTRQVGGSG